jgi:hypothetical protein
VSLAIINVDRQQVRVGLSVDKPLIANLSEVAADVAHPHFKV